MTANKRRIIQEQRIQVAPTLERCVAIEERITGYVAIVALSSIGDKNPTWTDRTRPDGPVGSEAALQRAMHAADLLFRLGCRVARNRGYKVPLDFDSTELAGPPLPHSEWL